jgi:hypothetical protein
MNKKTLSANEVIRHLIDKEKYLYGEFIPFHGVCMIQRTIYAVAIYTHCSLEERGGHYVFNSIVGAMQALSDWQKNEGKTPHPPGNWMKYKSQTGDIVNPLYNKNAL